jgi:predicted dehydrogenase
MSRTKAPYALKAGIVGCGKIAHNHAQALQSIDGVSVLAVVDTNLDVAKAFAAQYSIPHAFSEYGELLELDLDLVTICTPHPAHEEGVVRAAAKGLHVLCEKPVAVTLQSIDAMIQACDDNQVAFGVLFQRRFWPAVTTVREALESGALGQPVLGSVEVRFRRDKSYYQDEWRGRWDTEGGGVLINQAIHHLDLLQWFMGDVTKVSGRIATLRHTDVMEVEDSGVAHLEFASGAVATVLATTTLNAGLGGQIMVSDREGQTASVIEFPEGIGVLDFWSVGGQPHHTEVYDDSKPYDRPLSEIHESLVEYHTEQIKEFVEAIREGRDPSVTGREARKSLAVVLAIYESSRTGQVISLEAPGWKAPS